jgi:glutamine amidotransferase
VVATFWLLEAPDSLAVQSRRNPDGYGLGTYDAGTPVVRKRPAAAYEDETFAMEAKRAKSPIFVGHVRYATTGRTALENTHPFGHTDLLFAHNGVIEDLSKLETRIGDRMDIVGGDTDSERLFALIVKETEVAQGDVETGIRAAMEWTADNLPLYSLNFVMTTATDLWAFRYPESHELFVLERARGGESGDRHFDAGAAGGTMRVRSEGLRDHPAVVVASERMDEDLGWQLLDPGELAHVNEGLRITRRIAVDGPPRRLLKLSDLSPKAAHAQSSSKTSELKREEE